MIRFITIVLLFSGGLALTSCAEALEPMRLPDDSHLIAVISKAGDEIAHFSVEIANTEQEKAAGLMFRTDLPKDHAMLFVFDDQVPRFFWMKNTPTPLDIIYADRNGRIVSIVRDTVPFSTVPLPSGAAAKYAFEIHAGLSNQYDIHRGDVLIHPQIEKK